LTIFFRFFGLAKLTSLKVLPFLQIRIDGQDIRDVTLESLRKCIGVVPQDTVRPKLLVEVTFGVFLLLILFVFSFLLSFL